MILLVSMLLALLTTTATTALDFPKIFINSQYQTLREMFFFHRIASFVFGLVSMITTIVLPRVPERRTVFLYGSVLSLFFFSSALRFFFGNLLSTRYSNEIASLIDELIQVTCYIAWIIGFRWQELPVVPHALTPEELRSRHAS